jgi:colanic acid biosynthesis glycosyl transferase WcaI
VLNLSTRLPDGKKPIAILPWLDTDFLRPLPRRNAFSEEMGLNGKFVILYAGNLGLSQGLDKVLLAAQSLSNVEHLAFVFVGDGPNRLSLIQQGAQLGLGNVRFLPYQPRHRLPEMLATADVSLVSLRRGIGFRSLPSKTFPILASGRPILAVAEQGSDLCQLVESSGVGVCVPPDDVDALSMAILDLSKDAGLREKYGQHAREYAVRHHSHRAAAVQFEQLLSQAMSCA